MKTGVAWEKLWNSQYLEIQEKDCCVVKIKNRFFQMMIKNSRCQGRSGKQSLSLEQNKKSSYLGVSRNRKQKLSREKNKNRCYLGENRKKALLLEEKAQPKGYIRKQLLIGKLKKLSLFGEKQKLLSAEERQRTAIWREIKIAVVWFEIKTAVIRAEINNSSSLRSN